MIEAIKIKSVQPGNPFKSVIQKIFNYDIVKALGGNLSINTETDKGAEYIIKIPLAL